MTLSREEQAELRRRTRASTTTGRDCLRAKVVLLRAQGQREVDVAQELGGEFAVREQVVQAVSEARIGRAE